MRKIKGCDKLYKYNYAKMEECSCCCKRYQDTLPKQKRMVMRMRRNSMLCLCLLLCLLVVTGCGRKPVQNEALPESVETTAPAETVAASEETVPTETEPRYDVVVVNTAYGDLCYQEQWYEHMRVRQEEQGDLIQARFLAEFNGVEYALFELMLGVPEEEAYAFITDQAGTVRGVGVNFLELGEYPELSEDDRNQLFAMQEDINFVIENIK